MRDYDMEYDSDSKQGKQYRYLGFVIAMLIIFTTFLLANRGISKYKSQKFSVENIVSARVAESIDGVYMSGDDVCIDGYAFLIDVSSCDCTTQVFLRDANDIDNTESIYWLDVDTVERTDVNQYYSCDHDFQECGYTASIPYKKINDEDVVYEILVKLNYDSDGSTISKTISTGSYIVNGELSAYNPAKFDEPETTGTELDRVFSQGRLVFYRREEGMYVYQYEGMLYWIANDKFDFKHDTGTYIQYQLFTTQPDRLPDIRRENDWDSDNIGFVFEENEKVDTDYGPYRVASRPIPTEYAVSSVETGYYTSERWIWYESFGIDITS